MSASIEYHAPILAELLDRFEHTNTLEDNDVISLETELSGVGDNFKLILTAGLLNKMLEAAYSKGWNDKDC